MEIEKAFKRLLVKNPFYGLFCLSLPKVVTTDVDTLCVTKKGINCQLNINPDFWAQHTDDEQIALLTHELGHICLQHMFLSDSFPDPTMFNVSADAEVNSYIENLPSNAVTAKFLGNKLGIHIENGLGTKKYYEILNNYQQQQQHKASSPTQPCNGGQGGQPSLDSSPSEAAQDKEEKKQDSQKPEQQPEEEQPKGQLEKENKQYPDSLKDFKPVDDHSTWKDFKNIPEANKQLIVNNINSILKNTAEQVQKMRGTIPGELSGIIEKLQEKRPEVFNWKAYFRRMLGSIYDVNIKLTRRKESKRFSGNAGVQHKKKVSILVAIDTSGSVSPKELQEFLSEIHYVYKAGARVTILQCDTRITSIKEYDGNNVIEIKGRGGTDFNPPVDYYDKHRNDYASLIFFTDGEAPLPRKKPAGMVWVISSCGYHQDYYGKVIYIPKDNK